MANKKTTPEPVVAEPVMAQVETVEPMTIEELVAQLVSDIVSGNNADALAEEFVTSFVINDRPETKQVLEMLEMPSATLVESLKAFVGQSYQESIISLNGRGVAFLDELRSGIKTRLTKLAAD